MEAHQASSLLRNQKNPKRRKPKRSWDSEVSENFREYQLILANHSNNITLNKHSIFLHQKKFKKQKTKIFLDSQLIDHEPQWDSLVAESQNPPSTPTIDSQQPLIDCSNSDHGDEMPVSMTLQEIAPLSSISEVTLDQFEV